MHKILIKDNERRFTEVLLPRLQEGIPAIQRAINAFNKLDTGYTLQTSDIKSLIGAPDKFYHKTITKGEPVKVGGHKISTKAHLDMLDLPEGFNNLLNSSREIFDILIAKPEYNVKKIRLEIEYYIIDENGKAAINPDTLTAWRESVKDYAIGEDQINLYLALKKVVDSFNEFVPLLKKGANRDHISLDNNLANVLPEITYSPWINSKLPLERIEIKTEYITSYFVKK